ncbi:MAG: Rrf2 family transcriptional regulator [Steroidobacteraceae bacterium]
MSQISVQFSVASHMMAAMGSHYGEPTTSAQLAVSVNADPSFVRRVLSKLSRAGLVTTTRGRNGACSLSKPPSQITLLDIYRASEAPATFSIHSYPVQKGCHVSRNIKDCLQGVLEQAQHSFELSLQRQTLSGLIAKLKHVD